MFVRKAITRSVLSSTRRASSRAIQYTKHGQPTQVLQPQSLDVGAPASGQVAVKLLFAPINPADVNQVEGVYPVQPALPAVAGNEGCGVVEAVGAGVTGLGKGDLVITSAAGLGTWRTAGVYPASGLVKVPDGVKPEYAAVMGVNMCTAYRMLEDFVQLKKGDVVLANGGSSGVVSALASLCKMRGLRLVVEARLRPEWQELVTRLKANGAELVIDDKTARTAAFKDLIKDLPAPKLALNGVGGRSATDLARNLAPGGTLVTYGGMSRQPVTLPTSLLIFKDLNVRGFWMTEWNKTASESARTKMIDELSAAVKNGDMKVYVERHNFSNFDAALTRAMDPLRTRKVLLSMEK